ncbi:hypothetical protein [uncultured Desulfovibrio sp.]|uniref:hypothetical protein n=1 Tax=uncultured Desulfovibrio sp. TaxID=167968 RepID=UPI002868DCA2|nr:hypothetical protein [uncultured Desulfovibrio sp.]
MEVLNASNIVFFLVGSVFGGVAYHVTLKLVSKSYQVTQKNITARGDVAGRDVRKS